MSETCIKCGTDFPEGEAILCKCWEGTTKQRQALGLPTLQLPASLDLKGFTPTDEQVRCIAADPFYCLERITPIYAERHRALLTEEEFVELGVAFIEQHGPEEYIRTMLRDLKGEGAHMVPVPAK